MAELKDSVVSGSLRVTDKVYADTVQAKALYAPTASGGATFGPGTNGQILKSNGSTVYWTSDSDSHYTTHLYAGSGTAANAATTNGNTKLTVADNTTVRESVTIKGTGATTVVSDANGVVTINSTNTTYTAATAAPGNVASASAVGTSANYARQDHTHGIALATGDSNGQVKIAGTNVSVKGLGTAAYTESTAYAASSHTHDYLPLTGGTVSGTVILSRTTDVSGTANNKPALIVGGTDTQKHIEFDNDEIQAKASGTTTSGLWLNNDGGAVYLSNGQKINANNGTLTAQMFTVNKGDTPAAGAVSNAMTISFKNADGTATYTLVPIAYIGNSATDGNNSGVVIGSQNGTTVVGAGESSRTFPSVNSIYNDENLYLVADGTAYVYPGVTNAGVHQGRYSFPGLGNADLTADMSQAFKSITRSGTTYTVTRMNGSTFTYTQQDSNTQYQAGKRLLLTDTTFSLMPNPDTRNDNQPPSWYITNYPRMRVHEFKDCSKIGLSGENYCTLTTDTPWTDSSGGYPTQYAECNAKFYMRVGTAASTWGSWIEVSANTTYSAATESANGLMPAADKKRLNAMAVAYGTCSTAAATQVKAATVGNGFSLVTGAIVGIKFTNTNTYNATASAPCKLNVNSTGEKPIYYANSAAPTGTNTTAFGRASYINFYMYDGTNWVWLSSSTDNNNTYSNQSLGNGYGTCATAAATAAKVATLASYNLTINGFVAIKFTYDVPANATLNINSKGAKAIYKNGAAITAGMILAGDIATFVYDGTQYQLVAIDRATATVAETKSYLGIS